MNKVILFAAIIIFLILFIHPIDVDGDFYHHVNIGRDIITQHAFTHKDDLTFTAAGRDYIGNGWLSGVVFYLVYTAVGPLGINMLNYAVAGLTLFILYWYLTRCLHISSKISLLTLFVTGPVIATRWPYRPEMFMYVLLLGFFLIDYYERTRPWLSLLFPVLTILLAMFYGAGFPLVAFILLLLFGMRVVRHKIHPTHFLYYTAILISFPVAILNGYGWKSILFILLIPKMTLLWGDWVGLWEIIMRPELNFARDIIVIYCLFTAYVVVLAVTSWKKMLRYPLFIILGATVFMPFWEVRMRTFAAILSTPLIGIILSKQSSRWLWYTSALVGCIMTVLFGITNPPGVGENTKTFPPAMIQFIETNKLWGNAFNTPRLGAFLSYHLAPKVKTFIDTRDDLFIGTGVLEETQAFLGRDASISFLLHKYHIDLIIVNLSDGPSFHDLIYDNNWALVYFKDDYLIFIPRTVAIDRSIPILDTLDPYAPLGIKTHL